MATFDFVTSGEFRASLERDAEELLACMKAGAWKSVHVLAGSLIHATILYHLMSTGKVGENELLKLSLSELLDLCKEQQVLSTRTLDLAVFIRPYLQFIHPSAGTRLCEGPDETGARIAQALLEIIVNELSANRRQSYGVTAEQVVAKLQLDPSSIAILDHLLRKMNEQELERLLIEAIPNAYLDGARFQPQEKEAALQHLARCFRMALALASDGLKRKVVKRYIGVLEHESEYTVRAYETQFFRGTDLKFLDAEEREVVKRHFVSSLSRNFSPELVEAAEGMGAFLESEEEARAFFVPLVLRMIDEKDETQRTAIRDRVLNEYRITSEQNQQMLRSWTARLKGFLRREGREAAVEVMLPLEAVF
ncbi:MAG TPA: hypothetical protein VLE22_08925 [Bryobacteraceae bacterium]|nr:hypothetical protein [Bryobacteraceae bacterium]